MLNMPRETCANEWVEAICQILIDARDMWGLAVKEQCSSSVDPESGPYSIGSGQMLLPGIAEPYRWEFGQKG